MSDSELFLNPAVNQPTAPLNENEYSDYLLRNPIEIKNILDTLASHRAALTVFLENGPEMFASSLLKISSDSLTIDSAIPAVRPHVLAAKSLLCITAMPDKVRIQFPLTRIHEATDNGLPAFVASLPTTLLRLQRREYFRLTTPVVHPLRCAFPQSVKMPASEIIVVDISSGGLALALTEGSPTLIQDAIYPNCRIDLPETGSVTVSLKVRSLFNITLRNGSKVKRAGCEFVNLPASATSTIQRYILKAERERKARETRYL
jgi:c-di-GMP-binding flagellar brake protein YcgR